MLVVQQALTESKNEEERLTSENKQLAEKVEQQKQGIALQEEELTKEKKETSELQFKLGQVQNELNTQSELLVSTKEELAAKTTSLSQTEHDYLEFKQQNVRSFQQKINEYKESNELLQSTLDKEKADHTLDILKIEQLKEEVEKGRADRKVIEDELERMNDEERRQQAMFIEYDLKIKEHSENA